MIQQGLFGAAELAVHEPGETEAETLRREAEAIHRVADRELDDIERLFDLRYEAELKLRRAAEIDAQA